MSDLDCLGANVEIGFDLTQGLGNILQAAGGLGTGIAETVKQAQDEKQLSADQASALKSVLAADKFAALAVARADASEKAKLPRAAMDRKAADLAISAQQTAAANPKLSGDASAARAEAAQKEQQLAIAQAQEAPTDVYKAALVDAWGKVMNQSNNATIVKKSSEGSGASSSGDGGGSFLTKKIGPLPAYQYGLGAALAGLAYKFWPRKK